MPVKPNIYNVSWNKLMSWLIPSKLAKPKMLAICKALVVPISQLHGDFLRFRKQCIYDLSITPQICWLVKLLNDRLDYTQRRIYIGEGERGDAVYMFQDDEEGSLYLFENSETETTWVFTDSEVGDSPAHFVVYIPVSLIANTDVINSLLKTYKLPSRRYQIQSF